MKLISVPALLAAALFSVVVSLPFLPFAASTAALFQFEISVSSSQSGISQLFYDIGAGIREEDSASAPVNGDGKNQLLRFPLPVGRYTKLRFDPLNRSASMSLSDAAIRDPAGKIVRRFGSAEFKPDHEIALLQTGSDGTLKLEMTKDATDPISYIALPSPMSLSPDINIWPTARRITLPIFLVVVVLLFAASRIPDSIRNRGSTYLANWKTRPVRAVAVVAVLAVVGSSYPIVFLGKSYVSPNLSDAFLLYEAFPTLPGYRDSHVENAKGADVGALIWQHVPYSMLEGRALAHGELPLWNRYNSTGSPLLAQGQSMFGDPLHFLVIAARGADWAWDLKYLIAKWLLAAGVGLCVLRATRHLPSAAIVTAVMPFTGYFVFRIDHPALFAFCYAPWILFCWLGVVTAAHWRGAAAWVAGLLLADWTVINSGTVKEAYMSLLTLNCAGVVTLACAQYSVAERGRRLCLAVAGSGIFVLSAAPVWLPFLDALAQSYTSYNLTRAYQVQPSLALAFFDEILFRPFWEKDQVYNGSVNFVVLIGILAFLVNLRWICSTNRLALGLALGSLLPLALIFGVVPPSWIVQVPFLASVGHIDNSFFCPLATLLGVLAGCGFCSAAGRLGKPEGRGDLIVGGLLFAVLVSQYLAFGHTVQRSTYSYWHWGEQIARSPFVTGSLIALVIAVVGFGLVARRMMVRGHVTTASVLTLATFTLVLLWRHGLHGQTGFADYVFAPGVRVDFRAASPAVAAVQADQHGEPWRFVGLNGNAFHGWMNVYGLEGICGPDAVINRQYRELQDALGLERIWDWRLYAQVATLPAQKRAFDFLNVRHYFDYRSNQALLGAILSPVKMADLDVYRSETAWPRAFFTDRLATYAAAKDLGRLVNDGDGRPFAAMQEGDTTRPSGLAAGLAGRVVVPAEHYYLTSNTTSFDVNAPGSGIVVLTEAWLRKDFRARLDGRPVPYLRVNHAFKGVVIDQAGQHHIEFEYRPRRFTEALAMSGAGFAALLGGIWFVRRKNPG